MATHFKLLAVSQPFECSEMRQLVGLGIQYNNCEKLLKEQQSVGSQQRVWVYVTTVNRAKRKSARVREKFILGSFLSHIFKDRLQFRVELEENRITIPTSAGNGASGYIRAGFTPGDGKEIAGADRFTFPLKTEIPYSIEYWRLWPM